MEDINELRRIGDLLQSSSSRILQYVDEVRAYVSPDYETEMARHELRDAIQEWTNERRKAGRKDAH